MLNNIKISQTTNEIIMNVSVIAEMDEIIKIKLIVKTI